MLFKKHNNKITICLIVLIIALLYCNINKLYNSMNNNTSNNSSNNISNNSSNNESNNASHNNFMNNNIKDNFNNLIPKYNEIVYGMDGKCFTPGNNGKYCPNEHPNIPCSSVGCRGDNLTDEMKKIIYMYVYLNSLLEVVSRDNNN